MAGTPIPELLFIGNFLSGAGASRGVCEDLVDRLRGAGWSVRAASTKPAKLPRMLDMAAAVWNGRRRNEIAHVDVFSGEAFLWAAAIVLILRTIGKPHLLTLHGGSLPTFGSRWPGAVRWVLAAANAVTVPSEFLRREMRRYRPDLLLIPNPLDLAAYPYRRRQRPEPRLVWLRAFHETYNPSLAPRVLALLSPKYPAATLTMIGPDRGDGSLARAREQASALGVLERTSFVGQIPKAAVGQHLSRGDIFLNTTNVDNTPVSVVEALACGLCVVSTNVGGMADLVRDGEDGLLVPPNDPGAMVSAVARLLEEPGLAAGLSSRGRERVQQMDWSTVLPKWEALFRAANGFATAPSSREEYPTC